MIHTLDVSLYSSTIDDYCVYVNKKLTQDLHVHSGTYLDVVSDDHYQKIM